MSQVATILIPDISGYTEFVTSTEVDHSSHIINELLGVIVDSNTTGLTVGEIEGDAVLFYRKGEPMGGAELVGQCLAMFEHFHFRLKVIGRDALCECGACRGAPGLTLKFVAHHGPVAEIRIARFAKPAGVELIVAHRLMKNTIGSAEYILVTKPFFETVASMGTGGDPGKKRPADTRGETPGPGAPRAVPTPPLNWTDGSDEYPAIGKIPYRYATLTDIRRMVPEIPSREIIAFPEVGDEASSARIVIDAPPAEVYRKLTDVNLLRQWVTGLQRTEEENLTDRIGKKHLCIFEDMTLELSPKSHDAVGDRITLVEEIGIAEMNIRLLTHWMLERSGDATTTVNYAVRSETGGLLPPGIVGQIVPGMRRDLVRFKELCEKK